MRVYRDGRFQIQPSSLRARGRVPRPFFVGAQIGYHFTDWLALHAFSIRRRSARHDLTSRCIERSAHGHQRAHSPRRAFDQQIAAQFMAGAQATFIPLRGKLRCSRRFSTPILSVRGLRSSTSGRANVTDGQTCRAKRFACALQQQHRFVNANTPANTQTGPKQWASRMAIAPTSASVCAVLHRLPRDDASSGARFLHVNTSGTDEAARRKRSPTRAASSQTANRRRGPHVPIQQMFKPVRV